MAGSEALAHNEEVFALNDPQVRTLIDGVESRLASLETRIDERTDHLAEVMSVRLDSVHHRLGLVEDDMKIVKAHLLRHSAA